MKLMRTVWRTRVRMLARDLQHAASGFEMSMAMHPIGLRAIGAEVFHSAAGRMI